MAGLAFKSVLPTGRKELGDLVEIYDFFFDGFDLPGLVDAPAIIVLAARNVQLAQNFITVNAPPESASMSFAEAKQSECFIWRILPNPTENWILQVHQINPGKLKPAGNVLGFHSRDVNGEPAPGSDNFAIARIFVIYYSSE